MIELSVERYFIDFPVLTSSFMNNDASFVPEMKRIVYKHCDIDDVIMLSNKMRTLDENEEERKISYHTFCCCIYHATQDVQCL